MNRVVENSRIGGLIKKEIIPPLPAHLPRHDGEPLGVSFYKSGIGAEDIGELALMENMTLPRTFFGRSYIHHISFKNTDLSESCLCWNDFTDVDFTKSDLSRAHLRASIYKNVLFVQTNLSHADLRQSLCENCDFSLAVMRGAKLTRTQGENLHLSDQQRAEIDWQEEDGEEPDGG